MTEQKQGEAIYAPIYTQLIRKNFLILARMGDGKQAAIEFALYTWLKQAQLNLTKPLTAAVLDPYLNQHSVWCNLPHRRTLVETIESSFVFGNKQEVLPFFQLIGKEFRTRQCQQIADQPVGSDLLVIVNELGSATLDDECRQLLFQIVTMGHKFGMYLWFSGYSPYIRENQLDPILMRQFVLISSLSVLTDSLSLPQPLMPRGAQAMQERYQARESRLGFATSLMAVPYLPPPDITTRQMAEQLSIPVLV